MLISSLFVGDFTIRCIVGNKPGIDASCNVCMDELTVINQPFGDDV